MLSVEEKATGFIKNLGDPDLLFARAAEGSAPQFRPRVNAHIHLPPNFSAFDTVAQAAHLAAEQDVRVIGVSNYYDYRVYGDFAVQAAEQGLFPLFGLEIIALIEELVQAGVKINDPGNPGKMYICGKGITRFEAMPPEAVRLLGVIRKKDSERMARMTTRMAEIFQAAGLATGLDEEAVKERIARRHGSPRETIYLQERHVAQAFQEVLFERVPAEARKERLEQIFRVPSRAGAEDAVTVQNEIRSHLMKAGKPAYVEETFVDFDHAYRLILALGGLPCYPTLADGGGAICPYEDPVEKLIAETKARGIHCAEFIPIRNTPETLSRYVHAMRRAGITVTAGTEHNTLDLIPMEPTCVNGQPIPEDLRDIFWEGACVIAAHQYLTLQGRPGYTDSQGQLNPAYESDEARIAAFRSLGAAIIRQYQEKHPYKPS